MIDYNTIPASVNETDTWGDAQVELKDVQFIEFVNNPYSILKMYELKQVVVKGITYNLMDLPRLFELIRGL